MKKSICIIVGMVLHLASSNAQTVLSEDFNNALPSSWIIDTTHGVKWFYNSSLGTNNSGCIMVDEEDVFGYDSGSIETVFVDLTSINQPVLSFSVATVNSSSSNSVPPILKLVYNTGHGWNYLCSWAPHGDSIINSSTDLTPPLDKQNIIWHDVTYNLSHLANENNIQFAFTTVIDNGGYQLLDNIRIADPTTLSISQYELDGVVSLYPNPAQDKVIVEMSTVDATEVVITDVLGRQIPSLYYKQTGRIIEINTVSVNNGVYNITVKQGDASYTKKIIINR